MSSSGSAKTREDSTSTDEKVEVFYERTRSSLPSDERLKDIVEKTSACIQDNRIDEARRYVKEQYIILEVIRNAEEENQPELADKFFNCTTFLLRCNLINDAFGCYFKGLLLVVDQPLPYQEHFNQFLPVYLAFLSSNDPLEKKVKIIKEVRELADRHILTTGGKKYFVPMAVYQDLNFVYSELSNRNPGSNVIKEEILRNMLSFAKCLLLDGKHEYLIESICKPLTRNEFSESAELHLVWAQCLKARGELDLALQMTEKSLQLAETEEQKASIEPVFKEIEDAVKKESGGDDKSFNEEWLKDTLYLEPIKKKELVETVKQKHVEMQISSPKIHSRTSFRNAVSSAGNLGTACGQPLDTKDAIQQESTSPVSTTSLSNERQTPLSNASIQANSDSEESTSDISEYSETINDLSDDLDSDDEFETYYEKTQQLEKGKYLKEDRLLLESIELSEECVRDLQGRAKTNIYSKSQSIAELKNLLEKYPDDYKKCILQIENAHKAFCTLTTPEDDLKKIEIFGRSKAGKNFDQDIVVVEILKRPTNEKFDNVSEKQTQNVTRGDKNNTYGQVLGRLERQKYRDIEHPVFVCELDQFEYHLMRPFCKTVPKLNVLHKHGQNTFQIERYDYISENKSLQYKELIDINPSRKDNYIFLVAYLCWDKVYPSGAVIEVIESDGSLKKAIKICRVLYKIPVTYRPDTMEDVEKIVSKTKSLQHESKNREDLTDSLCAFTIDSPNTEDLDDALSIQRTEGGYCRVGVHISDVTAFVKKGQAIDKEAHDRGATYYPPDGFKPFHMFPEPLSQEHCSLIPNERRLALSIFFTMDENGNQQKNYEIKATVIQSRRKFTYSEVQKIIKTKDDEHEFSKDLKMLFQLAKLIRLKRCGHLMRWSTINPFSITDEEVSKDTFEAQYIVEEFMVLANASVADFVLTKFPDCGIFRCQNPPPIHQVKHSLEKHPLIADFFQDKEMSTAFLEAQNTPRNEYELVQKTSWNVIEESVQNNDFKFAFNVIGNFLHPEQQLAFLEWISIQEKAEYRCSGEQQNGEDLKHFSLKTARYARFTSPIRRYPDIVLHRLVHAALNASQSPYSRQEIVDLCQHFNDVSKKESDFKKQCAILQLGYKFKRNPLMMNGIIQDVSDTKIIFQIPGSTNLPQACKEVPLQLLKVSQKPVITKYSSTSSVLELNWQQRLYSHKGYAPRVHNLKCKLDPHLRAIFLPKSKWDDVKHAFLSENGEILKSLLTEEGNYSYSSPDNIPDRFGTVKDISSEGDQGVVLKHLVDFSMTFSQAQIIGIQFCSETKRGILIPVPQVLDLTPNFKICLQHTLDPIKYLAKYGTERTKGRRGKYPNCKTYLQIWLPIIRMESATASSRDDSIVINDLPVTLERGGGKFQLTKSFCNERNIMFSSMSKNLILRGYKDDKSTTDQCIPNDFICVKYMINKQQKSFLHGKSIWVAHGQIDEITWKEETVHIHFDIHSNEPPSEATQNKTVNMSIEIIKKPKSDGRTEIIVGCLENSTRLAKAVALGRMVPQLDNADKVAANTIGSEVYVGKLSRNNKQQKQAIRKALTTTFSLIQGPPGTGKTYTGIKLMYLFTKINHKMRKQQNNKGRQIVFCAPSNKAVDLVAVWMIKTLGNDTPRFVRMYGSTLENMDYPKRGRNLSSRVNRTIGCPDQRLKDFSLHHLIRNAGKHAGEILKWDEKFSALPLYMDRDQKDQYHRDLKDYEQLVNKASQEELKKYDVIFCTTAMASNPRFLRGIKDRVFQLIIDECGMCTEPECIATIIATKAKQVVLIGDHEQLRPVTMSTAAAELGLEMSLFERYSSTATFLDRQYRMNPSICKFVSDVFYDGDLKTGRQSRAWAESNPLSIWPHPETPYVFCHIEGIEDSLTVATEEGNEKSCRNMVEVEKVFEIVKRLLLENVKPDQINVMSQYNSQCHAIKEYIKVHESAKSSIHKVGVKTVEASQGGEWDYVVLTTVRSLPPYMIEKNSTLGWRKQNLGFITDRHKINVALSRARKGIIIVGNKKLLRCDDVWKELLKQYESKGCLVDAENFPPKKRPRYPVPNASRLAAQTVDKSAWST